MKRPPVETLRRVALGGVVVMVAIVAVTYGVRRWRAAEARRAVATPVASDVQQQAEKFTFSRSEKGHTLFTIEADRTTERAGKSTVLEDVVVHIYGRQEERADEIRTARCEYDAGGTQRVICPGEVKVLLRGQQGGAGVAPGVIELTTSALQFDPDQGVAWTDEPVRFSFPDGNGEAVGLRYQPEEPRALLEKKVTVHVARRGGEPVFFEGSRLQYFAASQALELAPPLSVRVGRRRLAAERLRLELDASFHTRRIEASGGVRAETEQDSRTLIMRAARAVAEYAPDAHLERLRASGQVEFVGRGPGSQERLTCQEAVFHFAVPERALERIVATGAAVLSVETPAGTRTVRAPELEFGLRAGGRRRQTLAARQRGTLLLTQRSGEQLAVTADRLEVELAGSQRVQALSASGSVETRDTRPGRPPRTTRSEDLRARFADDGRLAAAEQWGRFRAEDPRWRAEAGRAEYRSATGTLTLREKPVVWDATSRTSANLFELAEATSELRAQGEVRTTRQASAEADFASGEPVQLAAERLRVLPEQGWAHYEGQVRMWQGENRLAAGRLELFRSPAKLVAEGNVSGLFLVAAGEGSDAGRQRAVQVEAARFTYLAEERRGTFDGSVSASGEFGLLTAPRLEVFLAAAAGTTPGRLERAHASGGVRIERSGWQASSEEGEYRALPPTVVLWGGAPTILDPQRGSTRGARLTLFLADDTISIDSAEGTRTVTRRPWSQ